MASGHVQLILLVSIDLHRAGDSGLKKWIKCSCVYEQCLAAAAGNRVGQHLGFTCGLCPIASPRRVLFREAGARHAGIRDSCRAVASLTLLASGSRTLTCDSLHTRSTFCKRVRGCLAATAGRHVGWRTWPERPQQCSPSLTPACPPGLRRRHRPSCSWLSGTHRDTVHREWLHDSPSLEVQIFTQRAVRWASGYHLQRSSCTPPLHERCRPSCRRLSHAHRGDAHREGLHALHGRCVVVSG